MVKQPPNDGIIVSVHQVMRRRSARRYGRIGRSRTWCIGCLMSPFAKMNGVSAWGTDRSISRFCAILRAISYAKKPHLTEVSSQSDTVLAGMTHISRTSYSVSHNSEQFDRSWESYQKST